MSNQSTLASSFSTTTAARLATQKLKLKVGDDVLVKCGADYKTTYQAKVISFQNKHDDDDDDDDENDDENDDDENEKEVEIKYTVQGTKEFVKRKWISIIDPNSGRPKRSTRQPKILSPNHTVHGCTSTKTSSSTSNSTNSSAKTYDDTMSSSNYTSDNSTSNSNSYNTSNCTSTSTSTSNSIVRKRKSPQSKRRKRSSKVTHSSTTKNRIRTIDRSQSYSASKPRYKKDANIGLDSSSDSGTSSERHIIRREQQLRRNNRGTASSSTSIRKIKESSSSTRIYNNDVDIGLDSTSSNSDTETTKATTKNCKYAFARSTSNDQKSTKNPLSLNRQRHSTVDYDSPDDNPQLTGKIPIIQSVEVRTDSDDVMIKTAKEIHDEEWESVLQDKQDILVCVEILYKADYHIQLVSVEYVDYNENVYQALVHVDADDG